MSPIKSIVYHGLGKPWLWFCKMVIIVAVICGVMFMALAYYAIPGQLLYIAVKVFTGLEGTPNVAILVLGHAVWATIKFMDAPMSYRRLRGKPHLPKMKE